MLLWTAGSYCGGVVAVVGGGRARGCMCTQVNIVEFLEQSRGPNSGVYPWPSALLAFSRQVKCALRGDEYEVTGTLNPELRQLAVKENGPAHPNTQRVRT